MFDFDAGKIIVVGVVALVVIGPKELPRVMRQVGQTVGKLRRMASEFQAQFMEAMREAEMADVKDEMSKIAETAKINVAFDPVRHIRNEIGSAITGETSASVAPVSTTTVMPELPSDTIDLSAIGASQPNMDAADATSVPDAGLVAAGVAPQPDVAAVQEHEDVSSVATLDEVRDALSEKLDSAARHAESDPLPGRDHLAKEHTA